MKLRLIFTTALGLCLLTAAHFTAAQEKPAPTTELQFVSFPKSNAAEPVELLSLEGETITVELPTNQLSPIYALPPLKIVTLGKSAVDEKTGKPVFETYGEAPALASDKQIILVVRQGASPSDGLKLIPFDAEKGGLTGGKYLFFNASDRDIAGKVGDKQFVLQPDKHILVAPEPNRADKDTNRKYLYVYLYFYEGSQPDPFYSNTWRFSERASSLVFFYNDPHTGQVRTHSIRHYL